MPSLSGGGITLATTNDIDTASSETLAMTPGLFEASDFGKRTVTVEIFEPTADTTTGNGKKYWPVPASLDGWTLTEVKAYVITAGTTGTTDIQIHNLTQAVDMLTTVLTIDSGETSSNTAATAAVIDTSNDTISENDIIRFDQDDVSTTAAKGEIIELTFQATP